MSFDFRLPGRRPKRRKPPLNLLEQLVHTVTVEEKDELIVPLINLRTSREIKRCKSCRVIVDSLIDVLAVLTTSRTRRTIQYLFDLSLCQEITHELARCHQPNPCRLHIFPKHRCQLDIDRRRCLSIKLSTLAASLERDDSPTLQNLHPSSRTTMKRSDRWVNRIGLASDAIAVVINAIPILSSFSGIPHAVGAAIDYRQRHRDNREDARKLQERCQSLLRLTQTNPDLQNVAASSWKDARHITSRNCMHQLLSVAEDRRQLESASKEVNEGVMLETLVTEKDTNLVAKDILLYTKIIVVMVFFGRTEACLDNTSAKSGESQWRPVELQRRYRRLALCRSLSSGRRQCYSLACDERGPLDRVGRSMDLGSGA